MNKSVIVAFVLASAVALGFSKTSENNNVMHKTCDGVYIVNTTEICDSKGFRSSTPLEVYIEKGKVIKIEALPNDESPGYFRKVKNSLFPMYENLKVSKAEKLADVVEIDGCTGATYSTVAVQANIKAALDYYEKHK